MTTASPNGVAPALLFVIGASGTGKTTAVRTLDARRLPGVCCYYFDSIGVPTPQIMDRDFGGGEGWQAAMTARWVERLAENRDRVEVAVLDGQTRPSFIRPALQRLRVPQARTVLLDCRRGVREARLRGQRGQPDLATADMDAWAAYLRGQAEALGLPIIDTSSQTPEAVANALQDHIAWLRAAGPGPR